MRHSTFNMRTICLLAALSGITVLSAQTPGKPRVQTSAAPEETTVYKPGGKKQETAVATSSKKEEDKRQSGKENAGKKAAAFDGQRYLALKTNVIYDACALLNLAVEMQVHKKITVELPLTCSLWDLGDKHGVRTVALQPEARWWIGNETGRGHFVGLHAHVAWFNVKWNDDRYQDTDRPLLGAGISYGYKLPLSKHWGAEFNLGVDPTAVTLNLNLAMNLSLAERAPVTITRASETNYLRRFIVEAYLDRQVAARQTVYEEDFNRASLSVSMKLHARNYRILVWADYVNAETPEQGLIYDAKNLAFILPA